MWLQHMPSRIWYMLENQHVVVSGHTVVQVKYIWTSEIKIWNTFGQGLGGLDVENEADYHLNAPGLAVEDVLLIGMLALFFGFLALLVMSASLLKKVRNFYVFLLCHSSRACSSDYFWTIALSWQEPKRRRCPAKKSKLGDDAALKAKEPRSV